MNVVAGIIENGHGQVLLARRPEGKHWAGFWEFPGGKMESGESPEAALTRELLEELALKITILRDLGQFPHQFDWGELRLHVFVAHAESEARTTKDVQEFKWLDLGEVEKWPLTPPDVAPWSAYLRSRP